MRPFKYKPPRIHTGELRTPITFYEYEPIEGPEPGQQQKNTLHDCFARIDEVWSRDMEMAKANGTMSDVTITMRDPLEEYMPTNKHYLSIDYRGYKDKVYQVKYTQPDPQDDHFIKVIAGVTS